MFGASNFPLGVFRCWRRYRFRLGGGNTVIVKAHGAHPGTSELVGRAFRKQCASAACPRACSRFCSAAATQVGTTLMKHPLVKAGGFTGSRVAGRILMDMAASRPEPIPFYAEMSSTNPVFILPGALRERGDNIASGSPWFFHAGAGSSVPSQAWCFCRRGSEATKFGEKLGQLVSGSAPFHLLTKMIHESYESAIEKRPCGSSRSKSSAEAACPNAAGFAAGSLVFETDAETFLNSDLESEIFGPTTLLVPSFATGTKFWPLPDLLKDTSPRPFTVQKKICVTSPIWLPFWKPKSAG